MPDPTIEQEIKESGECVRLAQIAGIPPDRPAVNDMAGPHDFVPSEFAPDSGRCDRCGGGALAQIHLKPVDPMARIADALERIADVMEDAEQTAADRLGAESINNLVRGLTKAEGM